MAGAATAGAQSPSSSPKAAAEYYDLRHYQFVSGPGTRVTDNYFAAAPTPALCRLGIGPAGDLSIYFGPSTKLETLVTADL